MNKIIIATRMIIRAFLLITVIFLSSIVTVLFQRGTMPLRGISSFFTRLFHRSITTVLGIRVKVIGDPNPNSTMFVSNHLSWLDILVIGQTISTHFLAMIEVKSWPIVGWLASRAGTLYIKRGNKIAASTAIQDIREVLEKEHNVVIFAEGHVTDGHVSKFHSRLMQSAIDSGSQIQPIALRYPSKNNGLVNPTIMFTEDTTLPESLLRVMKVSKTEVEISFLEPIETMGTTRQELAKKTEQQIRRYLKQD